MFLGLERAKFLGSGSLSSSLKPDTQHFAVAIILTSFSEPILSLTPLPITLLFSLPERNFSFIPSLYSSFTKVVSIEGAT